MKISKINSKYIILPKVVDFKITGFLKHYEEGAQTLSVLENAMEDQFANFSERIMRARGKSYLPIIRMSDGEYQFILGEQPPSGRNISTFRYLGKYIKYLIRKYLRNSAFEASTSPGVSSGIYSNKERKNANIEYASKIKLISEKGILALHLTFNKKPFQEKYHPALKNWFGYHQILISKNNYIPFYFVYALLRGERKYTIFKDQRVLVIHSADGTKQERISKSLLDLGASEIVWKSISSSRSMYDSIDVSSLFRKVDIAIVGAGVGKPNILVQLEELKIPCIDAGFIFEIWADESKKWYRTYTVPDDEWENDKINFR